MVTTLFWTVVDVSTAAIAIHIYSSGSVSMHVALRLDGGPGGRGDCAKGDTPLDKACPRAFDIGILRHLRGSEARLGALVHGAPTDDHLRQSRVHGRHGVSQGPIGSATAMGNARGEAEVLDSESPDQVYVVAAIQGEGGDAVHIGGGQPAVVEGGPDGFAGELQFASAGVLRELGLTDSNDDCGRSFSHARALDKDETDEGPLRRHSA